MEDGGQENQKRRKQRIPAARPNYASVAKLLPKPYPDIDGITNAYKLSWMKDPVAKEKSPLALWDLHYLDNLTESDYRLIPEPDKTKLMMDLSPLVVRQASGL